MEELKADIYMTSLHGVMPNKLKFFNGLELHYLRQLTSHISCRFHQRLFSISLKPSRLCAFLLEKYFNTLNINKAQLRVVVEPFKLPH